MVVTQSEIVVLSMSSFSPLFLSGGFYRCFDFLGVDLNLSCLYGRVRLSISWAQVYFDGPYVLPQSILILLSQLMEKTYNSSLIEITYLVSSACRRFLFQSFQSRLSRPCSQFSQCYSSEPVYSPNVKQYLLKFVSGLFFQKAARHGFRSNF